MRYALIGATGIGGFHLEVLQAMSVRGDVKLAAVADPALTRLPEITAELASGGTRSYFDYQEMLDNEPHIDVVVISAPIPFHLPMTLECLKRDMFIYLEKPPVPLIQQLRTMIDADRHQRIGVGFQLIEAHWVQQAKRAIMEGKLGQLESIRIGACWPRQDNYYNRNSSAGRLSVQGQPVFDGPATNAMAHLLHNAMFFAGQESHTFDVPVDVRAEIYRARPLESYDTACLGGRLKSGVTFSAAVTHATEAQLLYRMELRGSEGWIRISEDGAVAQSSFPWSFESQQSTKDLLAITHQQFLEFAQGRRPRPSTSLIDTSGYVRATNGMMLSSGDIHAINPLYVQRYSCDEGTGYDVEGLHQAVNESYLTGDLFSELGMPWAIPTESVTVENLTHLDLPGLRTKSVPQPA